MKNIKKLALAVIVAVSPWAAHADTVIYSDNFDANTIGINMTPSGWSITNGGTVDIVNAAVYSLPCVGSGQCIDLDGSSFKSGDLTSPSLFLTANQAYTATFELSGNQRTGRTDTVAVKFGDSTASYVFNEFTPFTLETVSFTPTTTGNYTLSFLDNQNDNIGAILDNVSVQAVPEPATYAMLLLGLGFLGVGARRKFAVALTRGVTRQ